MTLPSSWTTDLVMERLTEAATTLRHTRSSDRGPRVVLTACYAVPADPATAYGYTAVRGTRTVPDPAAVTRLDQCIGWMSRWLSREACERARLAPDAGYIVWSRAAGVPRSRIAMERKRTWGAGALRIPGGNSKPSLIAIENAALDHLARALSRSGVPVVPAGAALPPARQASPRSGPEVIRWVLNDRPCGDCAHFRARQRQDEHDVCGRLGVAVAAGVRAEAPEGQPCYEERPVAAAPTTTIRPAATSRCT